MQTVRAHFPPVHSTILTAHWMQADWAGPDLSDLAIFLICQEISNRETSIAQPAAKLSLISLRLTRDWPEVPLSETSHLIFTQTGGGVEAQNSINVIYSLPINLLSRLLSLSSSSLPC